jgi:hypothetical protein
MLIYSGHRQLRSLFEEQTINTDEMDTLKNQLASIAGLYGEFKFETEAAALMDNFHLTDGEPKPDHPKLLSYNIRRTVHLLKLCAVASVSRSDELIIRKEDYQRAFDWLTEAEAQMPDIFKAMTQGGAGKTMEETWYYIFTTFSREQKPVQKHRIIQFLQERVPIHNIEQTISMMEQGRMIEKRLEAGGAAYVPKGRKADV